MKLTCDACKLTLNARDEDRGKTFTCPICRGPLHEVGAAPAADKPAAGGGDGAAAPPPKKPSTPTLEWAGGSLDDLLYMVNSQALAAVIEVNAPDKKGEVHVIAGGIDEAFSGGQKGDEALASLRRHDSSRFRVELRLPNESGSLANPNPDRGDLKGKPLAKLMRYCEEYVLTCDLEAWRGTETCRVEYRRGNIARTLINGIDAPEQLGEVMAWTSGNFRFVLPRLALPKELDEASRMQAKAAAETRISEQKAARKTMFGMPAAQMFPGGIPGSSPPPSQPQAAAPPPAQAQPSGQKTMFMGSSAPAPSQPQVQAAAAAAQQQVPAKTMLGMPVMTPPAAAPSGGAPAGGPSSVVIDSAYAAASAPPKAAEAAAPTDMHVTARGYQPVAATNPPTAQPQAPNAKAKTEPPQPRKQAEPEKPEKEKKTDKTPKQQASARKATPAPEKAASPWMNVGIAVGVAAVIVVVWLLVSFFSK
jgi:hypothetical protein